MKQENSLKFHLNIAADESVTINKCHCSAVSASRERLRECKVHFKGMPFACDCWAKFNLLVPQNQASQEDELSLKHLLADGVLDCVHQLSNSGPSPDQPGHGSCAHAALPLRTADPRARKLVNDSYALLKFNQLPVLCDSRSRLSHRLYNHVRASK